jgi:hypothetical protein
MKTKYLFACPGFLLAVLLALSLSVQAHHSVHIHFDVNKEIEIEGTITEVHFRSPHSYFYVEAKGPDGKLIEYEVESWSHSLLRRQGWTPETLKVGDTVRIIAKAGRKHADKVFADVFYTASGEELRVNENLPR